MGQVYRFNPNSGCIDIQEPSVSQLRVLQRLQEAGTMEVAYIGGKTPYAACIHNGWAFESGENILQLTPLGCRELRHQTDRAALAESLGVPNLPSLAKLL